jgi:molybdopterin-binding protein
VFFAILYQAFRDAPHSPCPAVSSLIAFRLTIRIENLRIVRSLSQAENDEVVGLMAQVTISIGSLRITPIITADAIREMHLKNDLTVPALVKSTEVMIIRL